MLFLCYLGSIPQFILAITMLEGDLAFFLTIGIVARQGSKNAIQGSHKDVEQLEEGVSGFAKNRRSRRQHPKKND